jgi:hypothetical protein
MEFEKMDCMPKFSWGCQLSFPFSLLLAKSLPSSPKGAWYDPRYYSSGYCNSICVIWVCVQRPNKVHKWIPRPKKYRKKVHDIKIYDLLSIVSKYHVWPKITVCFKFFWMFECWCPSITGLIHYEIWKK